MAISELLVACMCVWYEHVNLCVSIFCIMHMCVIVCVVCVEFVVVCFGVVLCLLCLNRRINLIHLNNLLLLHMRVAVPDSKRVLARYVYLVNLPPRDAGKPPTCFD